MGARLRLLERPSGVLGPIASEADVHYFCVGRDRWSVYDRRVETDAPGAFLGRLNRVAGIFEVTFADLDRPHAFCDSLNASRYEFVEAAHSRRSVASHPALRLV